MEEYSLVLEGGGAKGAYQIGAIKALMEKGYKFNAIVGTSIGAINAAFIAQGDIDKLEELWKTLSYKELMNINNDIMDSLLNRQITLNVLNELRRSFNKALKEKGIDTTLIRGILLKYLDEEKIRNSKIRFGLVTFCITDFRPQELFIEDIPQGKLVDYLLASSNLPVFKRAKIEDKNFLDGGAFDNCSVEMMYKAGYRNVIALRLNTKNKIRNYSILKRKKDLKLSMIVPSQELPNLLNFETKNLNNLLKYGYVDAMKQLNRLDGRYYAIDKISKEQLDEIKSKFTPMVCLTLAKELNVKYSAGDNIVDVAFTKVIPKISNTIADKKTSVFKKQILNIIEYVALKEKVNASKTYDIDEFIALVKAKASDRKKIKGIDKAIYYIIENI